MFSNRLTGYRVSIIVFMDHFIRVFGWYKFSMGNWKKNCFFNKLATTTLLALLLCNRGMYECLVTG